MWGILWSVALAADPIATADSTTWAWVTADAHGPELDPIVYGAPEAGFDAAVGIGAFNFSACTGSLITPRIVLTAAHCGADLPLDLVVDLGHAFFGADALEPTHTVGFTDLVIHPDYVPLGPGLPGQQQQLPEYDIAVLVLAADAPVPPVWIRTESLDEPELLGETVVSVGWGQTEAMEQLAGVKHSAELTVDRVDPFFVHSDSATNDAGANICSGDSGGPQYHVEDDGSLVQWGVHSWGDLQCLATSGSTRTDIVADWLMEQVIEVHGTADRCAFNLHYEDGVCDTFCDEPDPDCAPPDDAPASGNSESASGGCTTVRRSEMHALGWLHRRR